MKFNFETSALRIVLLASAVLLATPDVQADSDATAIDGMVNPTMLSAPGLALGGTPDAGLSASGPLTMQNGTCALGLGTSGSGTLTTGDMIAKPMDSLRERMSYGMKFFVDRGYSAAQAAGIVGNLVQESAINHLTKSGDKGTAHGIAQWRGERFTRLQAFASKLGTHWRDFNTQLAFVDYELKNHETFAYRRLMAARNVDEATAAMISFERPSGWTPKNPRRGHGWGKRRAYAQDALRLFASL
jgi:hypothetical protein